MTRFRRWLHGRGVHRFCREVQVVDHYVSSETYLVTDANEYIDATAFNNARPVYRTAHR